MAPLNEFLICVVCELFPTGLHIWTLASQLGTLCWQALEHLDMRTCWSVGWEECRP